LLFACLASAQQAQQPAPLSAGGPPADQKAIFQRGLEMYKAKSYANALRAFREAAESGNVEAMMYVGTMQASGQGTTASPAQAMVWFTKAANAGDGQAMCNIGILYYRGAPGVAQRYDLALRWFRQGSLAGNAQAMFNAGVLYRDGLGVPVDFSAAMDWFLKAATGENSLAMNSIGVMYQKGQGVNAGWASRWIARRRTAGMRRP